VDAFSAARRIAAAHRLEAQRSTTLRRNWYQELGTGLHPRTTRVTEWIEALSQVEVWSTSCLKLTDLEWNGHLAPAREPYVRSREGSGSIKRFPAVDSSASPLSLATLGSSAKQ